MQPVTKTQQKNIINIEKKTRIKILNYSIKNTKIQPLFTLLNAEKINIYEPVHNIIKSIIFKLGEKHNDHKNISDILRKHFEKDKKIRVSDLLNCIF